MDREIRSSEGEPFIMGRIKDLLDRVRRNHFRRYRGDDSDDQSSEAAHENELRLAVPSCRYINNIFDRTKI